MSWGVHASLGLRNISVYLTLYVDPGADLEISRIN